MINLVPNGLIGAVMKKGKFGFILEDKIYKNLNSLARANKKQPYEYLVGIIEKEYKNYIEEKLKWDSDND